MRPILFLIIIAVCFLACRKSDMQSGYTGLYISKQYKILSSPKMYTKNGEVADRASINQYLNALPAGSVPFFRNIDTVIYPGNDSIRFTTPDSAAIKGFSRWDKRVVKPQGDYVYLYPLDTLRSLANSNTSPFDEAVSKIGIYKPYYKLTCFGYGTACISSSYEAAIAQWQSGKLSLPLMNYSLIHGESNSIFYGTGRSGYNNVFDPSVITVLKDRDTLLVQSFELLFEKVR